jgi:alpha-beta hydrolase superfamily lysophospholipase
MNRRAFLAASASLSAVAACAPVIQSAYRPEVGFAGPRLTDEAFISFDGASLGLTVWPAEGETTGVVCALHGMNDYANAFHLIAPVLASQGIATYAFDQRGYGRSPNRGVWAGQDLIKRDVETFIGVVRAKHPGLPLTLMGESMGGADAILTMAQPDAPAVDRIVLLAPAVWGWSNQPIPYKTALWITAHVAGPKVMEPPEILVRNIWPTDNKDELRAMGRDKWMVWGARNDTLYGMVDLMEQAWAQVGKLKPPVLYCYGKHDPIIPAKPSFQAAARLKKTDRSAYYADGYHLLTRDMNGPNVIADVAAFIRDPRAPLPSGAPVIPGAPTLPNSRVASG